MTDWNLEDEIFCISLSILSKDQATELTMEIKVKLGSSIRDYTTPTAKVNEQ